MGEKRPSFGPTALGEASKQKSHELDWAPRWYAVSRTVRAEEQRCESTGRSMVGKHGKQNQGRGKDIFGQITKALKATPQWSYLMQKAFR